MKTLSAQTVEILTADSFLFDIVMVDSLISREAIDRLLDETSVGYKSFREQWSQEQIAAVYELVDLIAQNNVDIKTFEVESQDDDEEEDFGIEWMSNDDIVTLREQRWTEDNQSQYETIYSFRTGENIDPVVFLVVVKK
jgi:hypothetical protein